MLCLMVTLNAHLVTPEPGSKEHFQGIHTSSSSTEYIHRATFRPHPPIVNSQGKHWQWWHPFTCPPESQSHHNHFRKVFLPSTGIFSIRQRCQKSATTGGEVILDMKRKHGTSDTAYGCHQEHPQQLQAQKASPINAFRARVKSSLNECLQC